MRVVFLTHYFPPEIGAAQSRLAALAHGLADRGATVTVHTGVPHYPSGSIPPPYRNRLIRFERWGPVRIVRSAVYAAPNRGVLRRLADHAAFAAGAVATAAASGPADVVVAESPPLFTGAAGVGYAAAKRAAFVLNVSDLWPESAIELGALPERGLPAAAAHQLARSCYRRARVITAPTSGIVDALDCIPTAEGKAMLMPVAVDCGRFAPIAPRAPSPDVPLRVVYAGTLGMAQRVQTVVDAAAAAGADAVELVVAGDGPDLHPLRARIRAQRIDNVRLVGPVAPSDIPDLYAWAQAGVVSLRDLPIFRGAVPTKLLEVMAAARPVILAARGEAADLVTAAGAGIVVAPEDPAALAAAFVSLRRAPAESVAMGSRGRAVALSHDRGRVVAAWWDLLRNLADRQSARAAPGRRRAGP